MKKKEGNSFVALLSHLTCLQEGMENKDDPLFTTSVLGFFKTEVDETDEVDEVCNAPLDGGGGENDAISKKKKVLVVCISLF